MRTTASGISGRHAVVDVRAPNAAETVVEGQRLVAGREGRQTARRQSRCSANASTRTSPSRTARRRFTGPCATTTSRSSSDSFAPAPMSRPPTGSASPRSASPARTAARAVLEKLIAAGVSANATGALRRDGASYLRALRQSRGREGPDRRTVRRSTRSTAGAARRR